MNCKSRTRVAAMLMPSRYFPRLRQINEVLLTIEDDQSSLAIPAGKACVLPWSIKIFYQAGGSDDDTYYGSIAVDAQITR